MDELVEIPQDLLAKLRERAKESLYFFAKVVLGFKDLTKEIHLPICRRLVEGRRLGFILPRGWLKTSLISIAYPMWRGINNPNIRILIAQNTADNARAKLSLIKSQFETNDLLRALFPEVLPTVTCKWTTESLCLNRSQSAPESTFESIGVRGQITSRHYNIIIEDDTVAPDYNELTADNVTPTKEDIDSAIGWHRAATPLLVFSDEIADQLIVVGTRWFELDLLRWVQLNEPGYTFYTRACRETNGQPDEAGELTWPSRYTSERLDEIRQAIGPYLFSCLYLNIPVSSETMVFRKEWFRYYDTEPRHVDLMFYCTVDLAGDPRSTKNRGRQDYNVVMTTAKDLITGRVYVIDVWQGRASPGEVINEIFRQYKLYKFAKLGVEGVGYQASLEYWINERRRSESAYFMLELLHHRYSKEARIRGLQPIIASGNLLFRPTQQGLIAELESFPLGAHDDMADALAMAKSLWGPTRGEPEFRSIRAVDPLSADYLFAAREPAFRRTSVLAVFNPSNKEIEEMAEADQFVQSPPLDPSEEDDSEFMLTGRL